MINELIVSNNLGDEYNLLISIYMAEVKNDTILCGTAETGIRQSACGQIRVYIDNDVVLEFRKKNITFNARINGLISPNKIISSTLDLPIVGNLFTITGNGTINFIITTNWTAGSQITLLFTGVGTVKHNTPAPPAGTSSLKLRGSTDYSVTADKTLTLMYNGVYWYEIARNN